MDTTAFHLLAVAAPVVLIARLQVVLFELGQPHPVRGDLSASDSDALPTTPPPLPPPQMMGKVLSAHPGLTRQTDRQYSINCG